VEDGGPGAPPTRVFTMLYYLNVGWDAAASGGRLRLFYTDPSDPAAGEVSLTVDPAGDRMLVFRSTAVPHEVEPAWAERWAVATWFYGYRHDASREAAATAASAAAADGVLPPLLAATPAVAARLAALLGSGGAGGTAPSAGGGGGSSGGASAAAPPRAAIPPQLAASPAIAARLAALLGTPAPAAAAATVPAAAATPTTPTTTHTDATIFVAIPAYRDSELAATLVDLFKRAARPRRVHVGVVLQYEFDKGPSATHPAAPAAADAGLWNGVGGGWPGVVAALDAALSGDGGGWAAHVRVTAVDARDAAGPVWARHLAMALYHGQDFIFAADSHMRFVAGWDDALVAQWRAAAADAGNDRVFLTAYPPPYELAPGAGCAVLPPVVPPTTPLPTGEVAIALPHALLPTVLRRADGPTPPDGMPRSVGTRIFSRPQYPAAEGAGDGDAGLPCAAGLCALSPPGTWHPGRECASLPDPAAAAAALSPARHPPMRAPPDVLAAGCLFAPASWAADVPPDPRLAHLFFGEEATTAARAAAAGYAAYSPGHAAAFHLWSRAHRPSFREHADAWSAARQASALATAAATLAGKK